MIRRATKFDTDFLLRVSEERYPPFNRNAVISWLHQAIDRPDTIVVVSPNGGAVATMGKPFWGGPARCHLLFLVVRKAPGLSRRAVQEGVEMMRFIDHWRQTKGAHSFHFGEDTGANFRVLAKLLGASTASPTYVLGATAQSVAAEMFTNSVEDGPRPARGLTALEQVLGI